MGESKKITIYNEISECIEKQECSKYCWLNPEKAEPNYAMCPFRGKLMLLETTTESYKTFLSKQKIIVKDRKFECLKASDLERRVN